MNRKISYHVVLLVALSLLLSAPAIQAAEGGEPIAKVIMKEEMIEWEPLVEHLALELIVTGPDGAWVGQVVEKGVNPVFERKDSCGRIFPDGKCTWELRVIPDFRPEMHLPPMDSPEACEAPRPSEYPAALVQTGHFSILDKLIVLEVDGYGKYPDGDPIEGRMLEDFVINDDLIVDGSACIGFDCVNGEDFGFDTLRLKENNLRIHFDDTSVAASYPRTDWRIVANSSANGGGSYFAIEDASAGRTPFTVEANARSHSLYVDDGGRIGIRTSTPSVEVHVIDGDTPTLRLQQDGSSGFAPQTWDVAGNETNFFIRDVTNGSALPLRIRPGAPTSSVFIDVDGHVGIGTSNPAWKLDIYDTGSDARVSFHTDDSGTTDTDGSLVGIDPDNHLYLWNFEAASIYFGTDNDVQMILESDGELAIGRASASHPIHMGAQANNSYLASTGVWHDSSSREYKENIEPLRASDAFDALDDLTPVRYNYKVDGEDEYVGFIAEEVPELVATKDRKTMVSMDVVAVLTKVVQEQRRAMEKMNRRIVELENRLK